MASWGCGLLINDKCVGRLESIRSEVVSEGKEFHGLHSVDALFPNSCTIREQSTEYAKNPFTFSGMIWAWRQRVLMLPIVAETFRRGPSCALFPVCPSHRQLSELHKRAISVQTNNHDLCFWSGPFLCDIITQWSSAYCSVREMYLTNVQLFGLSSAP